MGLFAVLTIAFISINQRLCYPAPQLSSNTSVAMPMIMNQQSQQASLNSENTQTTTTAGEGVSGDSQLPPNTSVSISMDMNPQSQQASLSSDTTASGNSASFDDLLQSFGGNPTEVKIETTTRRNTRTGAYYLFDWNTLLDLDDQLGRRVNIRFQPKIGDPKRFYSISVP